MPFGNIDAMSMAFSEAKTGDEIAAVIRRHTIQGERRDPAATRCLTEGT